MIDLRSILIVTLSLSLSLSQALPIPRDMFSSIKGVPVKRLAEVTVPQSPYITKKRKSVDDELSGERERKGEGGREGGRERRRREGESLYIHVQCIHTSKVIFLV